MDLIASIPSATLRDSLDQLLGNEEAFAMQRRYLSKFSAGFSGAFRIEKAARRGGAGGLDRGVAVNAVYAVGVRHQRPERARWAGREARTSSERLVRNGRASAGGRRRVPAALRERAGREREGDLRSAQADWRHRRHPTCRRALRLRSEATKKARVMTRACWQKDFLRPVRSGVRTYRRS